MGRGEVGGGGGRVFGEAEKDLWNDLKTCFYDLKFGGFLKSVVVSRNSKTDLNCGVAPSCVQLSAESRDLLFPFLRRLPLL